MKRKLAVAAVVASAVGLIALNLSLRPDPEPEFEPSSEPIPQRGYSAVLREEPTREPASPSGEEPRAVDSDEAAGAEPAASPGTDDGEPGEDTAEEADGCDHPLIPARAGQWRLYRWHINTEEHVAQVRIRASRTRVLESGEREVVWLVQATSEGDNQRLAQMTLRTRCSPAQDSEDPWFGILELAIGHRLTRRTRRWRWPAELSRGTSFRGTATLDASDADARPAEGVDGDHLLTVTRNHIVNDRVEVEVPAGTFRAWRVAYEEQQAYGVHGETGTGTIWVAPDVGLVKSRAENSRGAIQTIELVQMGGD